MERKMNYQLGIYLLLPKKWEEIIGEIKNSLLPLNSSQTTPHISIYNCAIKKESFNTVFDILKRINQKPFSITFDKVKVNINDGYYFLDIPHLKDLSKLQKDIITLINPVRNGLIRQKDIKKIKNGSYSDKQVGYINKYGHARVFDLYNPHITFGISKTDNRKKLVINLTDKVKKIKSKSFEIKEITVGLFEEESNKKEFEKKIKLGII
ncbi:MAG: hypothetical protein ACD_58C00305G0005 [uncultured bacterium]|nr:MAG: hypothetical protein ACD_58C00305G0005 [uncultured bacterium]